MKEIQFQRPKRPVPHMVCSLSGWFDHFWQMRREERRRRYMVVDQYNIEALFRDGIPFKMFRTVSQKWEHAPAFYWKFCLHYFGFLEFFICVECCFALAHPTTVPFHSISVPVCSPITTSSRLTKHHKRWSSNTFPATSNSVTQSKEGIFRTLSMPQEANS